MVTSEQWQTRSAVFFEPQNMGKPEQLEQLSNKRKISENLPTLEVKKISPTKYRIVAHQAAGTFPLVFSESFNDGWKVYLSGIQNSENSRSALIDKININFKNFPGNESVQATKENIIDFINQGLISDLGKKDQTDFISKNFQGTIQNDNLSNRSAIETWFQTPLDEKNHIEANGFANSWIIDPAAICSDNQKCIKNANGSYDLELVVEYRPQRLFNLCILISGITFLVSVAYLTCCCFRKRSRKIINSKSKLSTIKFLNK
jgi:hypothetical protein